MPTRNLAKRVFVIGALTIWSGLFCFGQDQRDSIRNLISSEKDDTQTVKLHLLLAKEWLLENRDSAALYADLALEMSNAKGFPKQQIEAINMQGNVLQRQSMEEEAMTKYLKAIEMAEAIDYKEGLAKLYNNVALIHTQRGAYPEALEGFTAATRYEEETGNLEGKAQGINNIGVVFYYQGDYDKAMDYFLESVKIHESMGNLLSAKQGYNNIGAINEALGRHDEALKFYQLSLKISLDLNDPDEVGHAYNNIAGVYSNLEQWTQSETYYKKAIDLNNTQKAYYSLALNYLNLADMYVKAERADESEPLFEKAIEIVKLHNYKTLASELYLRMANSFAQQEKFEKALGYQRLYDAYKDSIFDENKAKAIAETEALYETEKKEREAAEAKAALAEEQLTVQRQNVLLILLTAGFMILIVSIISIYRAQRAKRRQLQTEAMLQEERTRAEGRRKLEAERNRISRDLHDHIGAQLTIISSQIDNLAYKEDTSEKRERFEQISDHTRDTMAQLRETIWAMNNDSINLEMLTAKLQDFLQRSQNEDQEMIIQLEADPEIALGPVQTINLFRICQEAVQNALKYAQFKRIIIHFKVKDKQLWLSISDDGKGMEPDAANRGYGLRNMEERMRQINGSFDLESKLGEGTKILLVLPLNTSVAL